MLDIHAHLYWESYDADRDEVLQRAFDAGIERMICVGTEPGDNPRAIEVAGQYENVYAAVGIHPHFFDEAFMCHSRESGNPENKEKTGSRVKPGMTSLGDYIFELRELAKYPKVVAIGECGLDYFVRQPTIDNQKPVTITEEQKVIQKEGFLAQINIAHELGLPLIIHTRPSAGTMPARNDSQAKRSDSGGDAYRDVFDILKNHLSLISHPVSSAVLHCYQGDTEITKKFLDLPNVSFSFAGSITYPVKKALVGTASDTAEVVKLVPLERLFVETDAPFLAPVPHRGERNEPAYAVATAEKICGLKGCNREELDRILRANFQSVFGKA